MERSDGRAASDNWRVWANCADSNCLIRTVNLWLREHNGVREAIVVLNLWPHPAVFSGVHLHPQ